MIIRNQMLKMLTHSRDMNFHQLIPPPLPYEQVSERAMLTNQMHKIILFESEDQRIFGLASSVVIVF